MLIKPRNILSSFNSRAREGRDAFDLPYPPFDYVSIHAPARGATLAKKVARLAFPFQFTRPRGARLVPLCCCLFLRLVSIHAPARGATKVILFLPLKSKFQFTRPRGARQRFEVFQNA